MDSREALRGLLLALEPIAHNHRPATPPDFSDEDPENWTTGTPATHSIAVPPRGPMVDAVIDAILSSDWLRARDQRVKREALIGHAMQKNGCEVECGADEGCFCRWDIGEAAAIRGEVK